jgi:hypothetical protein
VTPTDATNYAIGVRQLIAGINDVMLTSSIQAVAGVASKAGAGAFQTVVQVSVGRVVDTMRSRRNKIQEDPQTVGV